MKVEHLTATVESVSEYLDGTGWEIRATTKAGATQWVSDRGYLLLSAPDDPERDWMLDNALRQLAEHQDLSPSLLASDVASGKADQLRVTIRAEDKSPKGTLSLQLVVTVVEVLNELVLAAADRAAGSTTRSTGDRRRWRDAYTAEVRFGQTDVGSLVFSILLPSSLVAPPSIASARRVTNFAREASQDLYSMLDAVQMAARDGVSRSATASVAPAIRPTLRLLEALSAGSVMFELRWSVLGPPAAARRPLQLQTADLPSLTKVSDESEAYYEAGVAERAPGLAPAALPEIVENFGMSGRVVALRRSYVTVRAWSTAGLAVSGWWSMTQPCSSELLGALPVTSGFA